MESVIFLASLVKKKSTLFDPLEEKKKTGKAAWMVAFFNSCRLLIGRIFVRQCRMD